MAVAKLKNRTLGSSRRGEGRFVGNAIFFTFLIFWPLGWVARKVVGAVAWVIEHTLGALIRSFWRFIGVSGQVLDRAEADARAREIRVRATTRRVRRALKQ